MHMQVNPNAIFVHKRQEGNPVLKHIRNVRWQFADIVPDYQMGQNTCAVFLSLRYRVLYTVLLSVLAVLCSSCNVSGYHWYDSCDSCEYEQCFAFSCQLVNERYISTLVIAAALHLIPQHQT